jgi:hypothetical protein
VSQRGYLAFVLETVPDLDHARVLQSTQDLDFPEDPLEFGGLHQFILLVYLYSELFIAFLLTAESHSRVGPTAQRIVEFDHAGL